MREVLVITPDGVSVERIAVERIYRSHDYYDEITLHTRVERIDSSYLLYTIPKSTITKLELKMNGQFLFPRIELNS